MFYFFTTKQSIPNNRNEHMMKLLIFPLIISTTKSLIKFHRDIPQICNKCL
jgi:hypothetical protein